MKKWLSLMLGLLLVLTLCACTGGNKPDPEPAPEPAAPPVPVPGSGPEPQKPEKIWSYAVRTQTYAGEYDAEDGTKLASVSYEYPILVPVDENGAADSGGDDTPPQAMLDVCAAFNARTDTPEDYAAMYERLKEIADSNWEAHLENDTFFSPCSDELRIADIYQTDAFVSVGSDAWVYWGGAHPDGAKSAVNFDLSQGSFLELADLTNDPDGLRAALAKEIIDQAYASEWCDGLFPDFEETIRAKDDFGFCFGQDGMKVYFSEYEIGPHVIGVPQFTIPYPVVARFMNERALRLLELPQEVLILSDFYEAQEMWYWFEGAVPTVDDDRRTVDDNDFEYSRVNIPGVTTLSGLRERLLTRFADSVVNERFSSVGIELFRDIDGILYTIPVGRGYDMGVGSVDYTVELNGTEGCVLAAVSCQDYDELQEDWVLTGETYELRFPFVLHESGAVFTQFQCIW